MKNGYISLFRQLLENPVSTRPNYLAVFIYLLLNANFKDCDYILSGEKTVIKRGYFVGSIKKISEHFRVSISTVSDILNYFESENMIKTTRTNKYTIFKIINYDKFQNNNYEPETGKTPKTKKDGKPFTDKDFQGLKRNNRKQTENKPKQKNKENNIYNNLKNFVVLLYCKILEAQPDSSHFGFIGNILKKDRDNLTYLQRCLLLCYVLNQLKGISNIPKFKGAIIKTYQETSYSDLKNKFKEETENKKFIYDKSPY